MTRFTKDQLTKIIEAVDEVIAVLHGDSSTLCEAWDYLNEVAVPPDVVKRLAEIVLASLVAPASAGSADGNSPAVPECSQ